jgi:hypothetical protein
MRYHPRWRARECAVGKSGGMKAQMTSHILSPAESGHKCCRLTLLFILIVLQLAPSSYCVPLHEPSTAHPPRRPLRQPPPAGLGALTWRASSLGCA